MEIRRSEDLQSVSLNGTIIGSTVDSELTAEMNKRLTGCYLVHTYRACNLIGLHFRREILENESDYAYSEEDLGIQAECWLRVLTQGGLAAAAEEMYRGPDPDDESFQWDAGKSVFDACIHRFVRENRRAAVRSAEMNAFGDLFVAFENGSIIQFLINSTDPEHEMWRFINEKEGDIVRDACSLQRDTSSSEDE